MPSSQRDAPTGIGKREQSGPRWIWFITGPTACGKTTVAKSLAESLGFMFVEGDDYHPQANLDKMSRNEPLTDADRAAWLQALREHQEAQPSPPPHFESARAFSRAAPSPHLVVTCSALKRQYRDVLRTGGQHTRDLRVRFVFLDVPEDVLRERARQRRGHFAGEGLVGSQMEALERPGEGEGDVLVVKVGREAEVEETEAEVLRRVRAEMGV
ncbi:be0e1316-b54f-41cf-9db2-9a108c3fbeda [Thermothielavioides terrestris]|uniref:Gluconokinase n=2 Tax=Thermothielavioides terrestris TaxID=2587410 RepID=G2R157_THETT|nr:uncharacterized protein THITE_2044283 [Thermothielavioides terrestris NRRL 8126]AEO67347.1 hypothetical protein THITE_2044283 [Thermothielavioides terrestris NRRL 8126]SPQ24057.1 be0e1316-b54f-41cf-9db2-9a108c3fbeda [Thermothielavioides terrestris]